MDLVKHPLGTLLQHPLGTLLLSILWENQPPTLLNPVLFQSQHVGSSEPGQNKGQKSLLTLNQQRALPVATRRPLLAHFIRILKDIPYNPACKVSI